MYQEEPKPDAVEITGCILVVASIAMLVILMLCM
jgi:hypothetical protein